MKSTACVAVLLVEDDEALGATIAQYLSQHGYRVHQARSADSALALLLDAPLPMLILADLMVRPKPGLLVDAVQRGHRFATLPIIVTRPDGSGPAVKVAAPLDDILSMVAENCVRQM